MGNKFFERSKSFFKKNGIPFILGILTFFGINLFVEHGPSPDHNAIKEIKKFRKTLAFRRGQGVFYNVDSLGKYLKDFQARVHLTNDTNYTNYTIHIGGDTQIFKHDGVQDTLLWQVGFYWKMKTDASDENNVKHDFCIIPTLVDTIINPEHPKVFDYFEDSKLPKKAQRYNHLNDDAIYGKYYSTARDHNAYDNGQMWP